MVTIHIIDRDPAVRLAARRALEPAGFAVSDAADAAEATPLCPDLVVADLATTRAAGIRRRHPAARVLATGEGGLRKPFTASELLAAVRRCLAEAKQRSTGATTGSQERSARPRPRRS
jgi:DNA-binding response OmpR family regulator